MEKKNRAIVLAAGKGTRMHSSNAKVLAPLIDRPMAQYVIEALDQAGVDEIYVVVGHQADQVKNQLGALSDKVHFVLQQPQLGTAHAVMQAGFLRDMEGLTLVVNGDGPLLDAALIKGLLDKGENHDMVLLSLLLDNPSSYGRILRDELGEFEAIREARDCTREQLAINEVNSGLYCFNNQKLFQALDQISDQNAQHEFYLTDVAELLKKDNASIQAIVSDASKLSGINTAIELEKAFRFLQRQINTHWLEKGVLIENIDQVVIGKDVQIGKDVLIESGCRITGKTILEDGVHIGFGTLVHNSTIGKNSRLEQVTIMGQEIQSDSLIIGKNWGDNHDNRTEN